MMPVCVRTCQSVVIGSDHRLFISAYILQTINLGKIITLSSYSLGMESAWCCELSLTQELWNVRLTPSGAWSQTIALQILEVLWRELICLWTDTLEQYSQYNARVFAQNKSNFVFAVDGWKAITSNLSRFYLFITTNCGVLSTRIRAKPVDQSLPHTEAVTCFVMQPAEMDKSHPSTLTKNFCGINKIIPIIFALFIMIPSWNALL